MARPIYRLRLVAAVAFALTAHSRPARAESVDSRSASSVRGFDVLASAGWGASTSTIGQFELAPYGASFGVNFGYTWAAGFRLGGYFDGSLGHTVVQHRDPRIGRDFDFTASTSSFSGGLSMGWDVPLYCLVLRYSVALGVTAMRWDFQGVRERSVLFDNANSPTVGVHAAPGVALLWPYRWFEAGVGFDYLAQSNDAIPSGFVGKLLVGVRP